ncbi:amino acid--tRNA ligase-related protein [Embleya hyalina]|uniref:Lysine--tRNA ligase n=1 Tax=Embleya hyalina TaxID=516124 RepID=A0A401YWW7_9ACTN|nr:amino acid--tRNA ligase-related protein [Embleya hyalina]GCD99071.1 lysine--tRNA ligase [Embleya hyalina]
MVSADGAALRDRLRPNGHRAGGDEAATIDDAWLNVFDADMLPAGGLCIGLDRLVQVLTGAEHIDDVIPFPLPGRPG